MAAILRRENTGAYLAVLAVYAAAVVLEWLAGKSLLPGTAGGGENGWRLPLLCAACTFVGMAIMFGASLLNLRKMKAGFRELAEGKPAPAIPAVWCPVLTEARLAALELADKLAASSREHPPRAGESQEP
jgi:hypothetical protein